MSRKLLLIFGSVLVLAIAAVIILVVLQRRTTTPAANTNGSVKLPNVNTVILNTNQGANANGNVNGVALDPRTEVQQLGRNFASIYASFSTQNTYKNITDLYFYMTPALKADQEKYVASQLAKTTDTSIYHGITSEPRIVNVEQFDNAAGTATVKVTLQRVETSGSNSNAQTYNQDITLGFEKVAGAWKVGHITWGARQ